MPRPAPARPAIDVLLPVFRARRTLPSALGDVLATPRAITLRVLAIVDVPPAGDDGSLAWLQAAARRDPRVLVLPGPGRGISAALQAGLAAVTAPLVAHMEADDRSAPERLPRLAAALAADPSLDGVTCRAGQFGKRTPGMRRYLDWQNALVTHEAMARERFVEIPALHQTGLYRAEALRAVGGYDSQGAWPADIDFWLRWFEAAERATGERATLGDEAPGAPRADASSGPASRRPVFRVAKLPRVLYRWRQHAGQSTRGGGTHALATLRAAKAHYLARHLGRDVARGITRDFARRAARSQAGSRACRPVVLLSVGATLAAWAQALASCGVPVVDALDWKPRADVPAVVVRALAAGPDEGPAIVAAYGNPEARARVRTSLRYPSEPGRLVFTA